MESKSFKLAKKFLGKKVKVKIDRPLGSKHPKWKFEYPVNYGYLDGVIAPDGEDLDAYLLGVDGPVAEFEGIVIAIIHRIDNDHGKLVVVPYGKTLNDEEIEKATEFQEKWFKHTIVKSS
jgi:inorganic pyrophosphatase